MPAFDGAAAARARSLASSPTRGVYPWWWCVAPVLLPGLSPRHRVLRRGVNADETRRAYLPYLRRIVGFRRIYPAIISSAAGRTGECSRHKWALSLSHEQSGGGPDVVMTAMRYPMLSSNNNNIIIIARPVVSPVRASSLNRAGESDHLSLSLLSCKLFSVLPVDE